MIQLGRLKINNQFMLAPMSMYSDIGFRKICEDYGCAYSFTEQIYASEFVRKIPEIRRKLDLYSPVGLQLITNSAAELKQAIRMVNERKEYPGLDNVRSIDLNLGCPTQKIMENNMGAALLKQPKLIRELFKTMRKESSLPVSVKIRLAVNSKHKKTKPYLRIAKIAEEEELDFLTIHLRTAGQMYTGKVDLSALKEIRENTSIKLVGNGGVHDAASAQEMLKHCDAVMIGQHALREPYLFRQLAETGWTPDAEKEKLHCIKRYLEHADKYDIGFQHIKIHLQSFLRGMEGKEKIIEELTHTHNTDEIKKIIEQVTVHQKQ